MGDQGEEVEAQVDADVHVGVEVNEAQSQASATAPAPAPAPPARPASHRSYSQLARAAMFNNVTASAYASASASTAASSSTTQTPTQTTPPGFHVVDMAAALQQRGNASQNNPSNQSSSSNGKPLMPGPVKTVVGRALGQSPPTTSHHLQGGLQHPHGGVGRALTDTPVPTAPPSPQM